MTARDATTSPATTGEGVITDDDLVTLKRIVNAFEARFVEWYVAQPFHYRTGQSEDVEATFQSAEKFSFDYVDEDGNARFSHWHHGDEDRATMPWSAILGTTDEFVQRMREEREERIRKEREQREQQRREAEERKRREAELAERRRLAERDRIFREECARRGIEVPS